MIFKNECNCIVDEELLAKAVDAYCKRINVYCNNEHRITLHNSYPTIVISRKHLYVHDLLRMYLKFTRKNYVVHHKDFNKLNNAIENLEYISAARHSHIHSVKNWKKWKKENKQFKRVKIENPNKISIPEEILKEMLKSGLKVNDMAEMLNCSKNTIYRRINEMKIYEGK